MSGKDTTEDDRRFYSQVEIEPIEQTDQNDRLRGLIRPHECSASNPLQDELYRNRQPSRFHEVFVCPYLLPLSRIRLEAKMTVEQPPQKLAHPPPKTIVYTFYLLLSTFSKIRKWLKAL